MRDYIEKIKSRELEKFQEGGYLPETHFYQKGYEWYFFSTEASKHYTDENLEKSFEGLFISERISWWTFAERIKEMEYTTFLETPYWKIISYQCKIKANFKCKLCNSDKYLETHHRNYEIHGWEHYFLDELIPLCKNCHSKFHKKMTPSQNSLEIAKRVLRI